MDIAALSTAMSQADLGTKVGVAVSKLTQDTMEQNAENLTEMMRSLELSVNPNVGGTIDIRL